MHLGLECFTFRGDSHSSKFLVICSDIDMLWTATACLFSLTSWHRHISWAHFPEAVCSCGGFGTLEASTHLLHQPGQHGINHLVASKLILMMRHQMPSLKRTLSFFNFKCWFLCFNQKLTQKSTAPICCFTGAALLAASAF